MPVHANTYSGGIDRDSSKNKYQPTSYYNMKNMRLTSFDELSNGAIQSIEGNTIAISAPTGYESDIIIGHCVIRNWLVVWSTADTTTTGGRGSIWKTDLSIAVPLWTNIYQSDQLYLSTQYPIYDETIGYYESSDIIKVYWTDNHNMIRHINIMDTYDATYDVTMLDILPDLTISTPVVKNIGGGNLHVGKVQYAFQYYNLSGIETSFSPCTQLVHLTKSSEYLSGSNIRLYQGTDALDSSGNPSNSGKSVTLQINDVDLNYERVRVVAIQYRNLYQEPDIHIVGEYDVFEGLYVTDIGNYTKGTLTLNAFRTLGNHELYAKTISQKGNKALIGNITEKFFDIDFDARAYRYGPTQDSILTPYELTVTDVAHINLANTTNDNLRILMPTPPAIAALLNDTMGESGVVTHLELDYSETVLYNTDSGVWTKFRSAGDITYTYISDNEIEVHITNFNAWALTQPGFDVTWTVDDVLAFLDDVFIYGTYEDAVLGHDIDFTGLGTGSNIVFAGDALSFLVTANVGDYFTDFVAFEPATGAVQITINYDYTIDYYYTFTSVLPADFDYIRQEPAANPVNWIFDIHKLSAGFFFTTLDPFNPANIVAINLVLSTEYTYDSGVATPRIVVYNLKTNTEDTIANDVLTHPWPTTTYTLGSVSVPEDHDCINPYNYDFLYGQGFVLEPQIDEYATFWDSTDFTENPETHEPYIDNQFKFQSDLSTLGGEGPNVKFEFVSHDMVIDVSADTRYVQPSSTTIESLVSYDSHKNPLVDLLYTGYKRDEVYRFGLVFIDVKGRESFVKWIGDIKFPTNTEIQTITYAAGETTATNIGIKFTVNVDGLYAHGIRGYKIVRVERKEEDRTIYGQGIISTMFLFDGTHVDNNYGNMIVGYPRAVLKTPSEGRWTLGDFVQQPRVLQYMSPEVNLFKSLQPYTGDYIKIHSRLSNRTAHLTMSHQPGAHLYSIECLGVNERTTIINGADTYANSFYDNAWHSVSKYKSTEILADVTDITVKRIYNVLDGVMAGEAKWNSQDENAITLSSVPGGYSILNRSMDRNNGANIIPHHEGISGTCAIVVIDDDINVTPLSASADEYELYLVDYKVVGRAASQYGGLNYEARISNAYIECGAFMAIDSTDTEVDLSVYGGDTYIGYFEHLRTIWEAEDLNGTGAYDVEMEERYSTMIYFPCESHINIDITHGDKYSEWYDNTLIYAIREEAGTYDADRGDLVASDPKYWVTMEESIYNYNPVYSQPNSTRLYYMRPYGWESIVHDDTLIKISLEKYPREEVDAYLKFLTDNEKLLPTEFGPVNDLFLFKNYMMAFMDHAFGTISIDERALLPIQNNSILELGAANNLQHFEFISNRSGCIHPQSIDYCGDGFVWYDAYNASIGYYNGQTQDVGLAKGMSSEIKKHTDLLKRPQGNYSMNQLHGGNVMFYENQKYKETLCAFVYSEFAVLEDIVLTYNTTVKNGYLYNWYAVNDARNITSNGWHVPTQTEYDILFTYIGGKIDTANKLKEIGTVYWLSPNAGATNEYNLNIRGVGYRNSNGIYGGIRDELDLWTSTTFGAFGTYVQIYTSDNNIWAPLNLIKTSGSALRIIKDSTTLLHGETATYTGNDGKIYRTICIGTQEWVADNICETLYRDLTSIPEVTNNAAWQVLITGARCSYNNLESNALTLSINENYLQFRLDYSPGHYENMMVVINGEEYLAETITYTSTGVGHITINTTDNTISTLTPKWVAGRSYFVYFKDLSKVYSYSSIINGFMYEVDIMPTWLVEYNNQLYDVYGRMDIWKEYFGNYGRFYGSYRNGEIEYVINPKQSLVCLFNNFEYAMESYSEDILHNIEAIDDTWDYVRVSNDYQYSASSGTNCVFTLGSGIIHRTDFNAHELNFGDQIMFSGSIPAELENDRIYYVIKVTATNFAVSYYPYSDTPITFAAGGTGMFHTIDIPIADDSGLKRRIRTYRLKDFRSYKGYVSGVIKPRMRDTYQRMKFKYIHADNKRILMHDFYTYYTIPRESTGNKP